MQTFELVRKEDRVYIDKTKYVYNMTHADSKCIFLSRPRRFGKSLLVSTLKSYFEGKKDLFRGLAIERLENDWEQYPVIHFSLAGGKHQDEEQLNRFLDYILKENENNFGIKSEAKDANVRLANLITTAYKQTGRQVVVLIDEYDAPLLDVVHTDEQLDKMRCIMRNFFSPLKD